MENHTFNGPWKLSVDCGGSFTGACLYNESTGEVHTAKIPSTPGDQAQAVMEIISLLCEKSGADLRNLIAVFYGSSVAINRILQNTVPKTALLVTRGFRDILLIERQYYNGGEQWDILPLLFTRSNIYEISERMLSGGQVHIPLDDKEILNLVPKLKNDGIDSIAISFLHSHKNPSHEQKARDILKEQLNEIPVTISYDLLPFPGEIERAGATAVSAAIRPLLEKPVNKIVENLSYICGKSPGFFVMQSDGSALTARQSADEAVRAVFSSHTGGMLACAALARKTGRRNIMTLDMGGDCTAIGIVQKEKEEQKDHCEIAGNPSGLATYNLFTVASGGGSIARIDRKGLLQAGPGSSGAHPGPACCGGKLPTCTDANLVLGRLNQEELLFRGGSPNILSAREAINKFISVKTGVSIEAAATGIIEAINSNITHAIKHVLIKGGHDPGEFTLTAFGGSGPLHAAELASKLGIPQVIVPLQPGFQSALGLLSVLRKNYVVNVNCSLTEAEPDALYEEYNKMAARAAEEFVSEGIPPESINISRSISLRYRGHQCDLQLQFPAGKIKKADLTLLDRSFKMSFFNEYGFSPDIPETEIACLKLSAFCDTAKGTEHLNGHSSGKPGSHHPKPSGSRRVLFQEKPVETPVFYRKSLIPYSYIEGPAVVDQYDTTTVVCPGMSASVDSMGNIVINVRS